MRRRRALAASGAKIAMATTAAARRRRIASGDGKSSFRRIGFSRVGTRGGARNDGDTHSAIVCVGKCCLGSGPKKLSSRVYLSSFLARERRAPSTAHGRLLGTAASLPTLVSALIGENQESWTLKFSAFADLRYHQKLPPGRFVRRRLRNGKNARPVVHPPATLRAAPSLLTRPAADRRPPRGAS